jgi:hypothetical protein
VRHTFDSTQQLTVVEHLKNGVTMVRDERFCLAPMWSGLVLQNRTQQGNNRPRGPRKQSQPQHRSAQ